VRFAGRGRQGVGVFGAAARQREQVLIRDREHPAVVRERPASAGWSANSGSNSSFATRTRPRRLSDEVDAVLQWQHERRFHGHDFAITVEPDRHWVRAEPRDRRWEM
jgi:hypothetical protein